MARISVVLFATYFTVLIAVTAVASLASERVVATYANGASALVLRSSGYSTLVIGFESTCAGVVTVKATRLEDGHTITEHAFAAPGPFEVRVSVSAGTYIVALDAPPDCLHVTLAYVVHEGIEPGTYMLLLAALAASWFLVASLADAKCRGYGVCGWVLNNSYLHVTAVVVALTYVFLAKPYLPYTYTIPIPRPELLLNEGVAAASSALAPTPEANLVILLAVASSALISWSLYGEARLQLLQEYLFPVKRVGLYYILGPALAASLAVTGAAAPFMLASPYSLRLGGLAVLAGLFITVFLEGLFVSSLVSITSLATGRASLSTVTVILPLIILYALARVPGLSIDLVYWSLTLLIPSRLTYTLARLFSSPFSAEVGGFGEVFWLVAGPLLAIVAYLVYTRRDVEV